MKSIICILHTFFLSSFCFAIIFLKLFVEAHAQEGSYSKEAQEILDTYKKDLDIFIKSTIEYNMSFYSFKQLSRDNMNFVDLSNVEERFLEFFEINEEDVKRLF